MADDLHCNDPDCPASLKNHAWGRVKADGWFFQKYNGQWCPDHIPGWVNRWRSKK